MWRLLLATAWGATAALLLAVIGDVFVFDIPARQRGEILGPRTCAFLSATLAGAIGAFLCAYKFKNLKLPQAARYLAIGILLGILFVAAAGLVVTTTAPLRDAVAVKFTAFWLKTMIPIGAFVGIALSLFYYWLTQRSRLK